MKKISQMDVFQKVERELALRAKKYGVDLVESVIIESQYDHIPACKTCNDQGVVYASLTVGDPNYAKFIECPKECQAVHDNRRGQIERLLQAMEKRTNRRDRQYPVDFNDYEGVASDNREFALYLSREFLKNPWVNVNGVIKSGLVFFGDTGTGKTFLASAITNELLRLNKAVWFSRVAEIIQRVQECYNPSVEYRAEQMIDFFCRFDYLVMDEFDMHDLHPDKLQIIESIIDYRYRNESPIICTTNLNQEQFTQRWGERTADRLIHMAHWVPIQGKIRNQNRPIGE